MKQDNFPTGTWKQILSNEFEKPYFQNIQSIISENIKQGICIYPQADNIFSAFKNTPFEELKVVILWQDPYHWAWQAHGLSFSVPEWAKIPPSLRNIYKELLQSWEITQIPEHWNLSEWSQQGVLLLNSILTVQAGKASSHSKIWWEQFTDSVIQKISQEKTGIIFLLWWSYAQTKKKFIDESKHFVIETTHPSPFSAYRWFLGSNCFIECNKILEQQNKDIIDWNISEVQSSLGI